MDINELKQMCLEEGVEPELLERTHAEGVLLSILEMQKGVNTLKSEEYSVEIPQEEIDIRTQLMKFEQIPVPQDTNSDEYRDHQNKGILLKNKIREELGLEPLPYHILDSQINDAINIGAEQELLNRYRDENGRITSSDGTILKQRIETILAHRRQEKERIERDKAFIRKASDRYVKAKQVPPHFLETEEGVIVNLAWKTWRDGLISLKSDLDKKVKAVEDFARDMQKKGVDYKVDRRQSVFVMKKGVDELIEIHKDEMGYEPKKLGKSTNRLISDKTLQLLEGE